MAETFQSAQTIDAAPQRRTRLVPQPKPLPLFHVILLDDNQHTYPYVIEMLGKLFAYSFDKAYAMARAVDTRGRVIVLTTHQELAELKRDQIRGFGGDIRSAEPSSSSMRAIIVPAN